MPPRININDFRDEIEARRQSRESVTQILSFLNNAIIARGGSAISINTLKRQLSAWGINRTTAGNSLEAFFEDISDMYFEGVQIDQILDQVNTLFEENNLAKISRRTLLN